MTYGWHFLREDKRLGYGDGMLVVPGETLVVEGKLKLCKWGLHASKHPLDALKWAPGPIACRVRLGGTIVHGGDKMVASERTCLWMVDATSVLHEFACWCAESVLHLVSDSVRPVYEAATAAKRGWLRGDVSDGKLTAAWDAARDAAWAAAIDAAWDAARTAAWAAARNQQLERLLKVERRRQKKSK